MKALRKLSTTAAVMSFLLIFTGGLVRVSGAGLGCPDWPRCFGRWLPPTSIDQLPANIDPSLFNFTLAWIEYGNRLLGMLTGLFVLATAILAIIHAKRWKQVWIPAVSAAVLVAYIGWQGGQVVAATLEPLLVSVHMMGALLVASLALFTAQQAHYISHPEAETESRYQVKIGRWIAVAWGAAVLQSALGTQVRAAVKLLMDARPLAGENAWLNAIGPIRHIHEALGLIVAGLAVHIAVKLLKRSDNPSSLVVQSAWALGIVGVVQFLLGLLMVAISYADILKLFHLWGASLIVGLLLMLYVAVRQSRKAEA
jgi:cytochrome c oxidase assembly protein subunit 15